MTEFVSAADAAESGSAFDQRAIRDEIADIIHRLRTAMDAGLSPDDMRVAQAEKAAADAAEELLGKIF